MPHRSDRAYYDERWSQAPLDLNSDQILRLGKILCAYAEISYRFRDQKPSICDLGCGTGWLSNELSKFGSVVGIDRSSKGIELAAARHPHVRFICADALTFATEERFDVVVSSEILEHIEDQAAYLAKASHLIQPRGFLILTCPNGNAWPIASPLSELQPVERWPTPRRLRTLLDHGFDVLTHETFLTGYSQKGVLRWANSRRIFHAARALRLEHVARGFLEQFEMGLYQIVLARKKS